MNDSKTKSTDFFSHHLNDIVRKSISSNQTQYSVFLTSAEQAEAELILKKSSVFYSFYGGFEDAERKILSVSNYDGYECIYPIIWLKITVSDKAKRIKHSDYLGSVMSLGIERSVFGDIIVIDNCAFVPIINDFLNFFESNLQKIGGTSCTVTQMGNSFIPDYERQFSYRGIIISSNRLDCLIATLGNMSREKSNETIKRGCVSVNYSVCQENTKKINENDTIVIRGIGKFIVCQFEGTTHKERLKIKIKKYI